jgi:hypothetical protein
MKSKIFSVALMMLIILMGCSFPHYYYSPNSQNVPLFKDSNHFSGLIAGSSGVVNKCLELQAGYSFQGHMALTGNFMIGGQNNDGDNYQDYSKINYFEGAAGYYNSFGNIGVFELYGGLGRGSQHHVFAYKEYVSGQGWEWVPDGSADLMYSRIFVQPDIGIKLKWLEAAVSCRLSSLNFSRINVYNSVHRLDELNTISQNSTPWLLEPAITFRVGGESVKAQVQLVSSNNLSNSRMKFEDFRFNVGLQVNLFKKKTGGD